MKMKKARPTYTIGRIDKADFPQFELFNIEVKVDTGAYNSAIHCHHIRSLFIEEKPAIGFVLLDPNHEAYHEREHIYTDFKIKRVKSSNGQFEERYLINTSLVLFGRTFKGYFSLADRSSMRFPVLLGRRILLKHFIVDVSKTYLSYQTK